jgi:hypothetical protein
VTPELIDGAVDAWNGALKAFARRFPSWGTNWDAPLRIYGVCRAENWTVFVPS